MSFTTQCFKIITVLSAGCFIVYGCENDLRDIPGGKDKKAPLEELHNVESYLSQGGKVKGKLTAPLMFGYQGSDSPYYEFPKTLHIDFYNDSLLIESTVDAKYGKYRQSENKVFLKDSVIVINKLDGKTLRSDELWWDQNAQKFYTNKPARYSQQDGSVNYGKDGLEAKQDLSDIVFYNNSGVLPVPEQDTATHVNDSLPRPKDTLTLKPATKAH